MWTMDSKSCIKNKLCCCGAHQAFPAISNTIKLRPWNMGTMMRKTRNRKQMKKTMVWMAIPVNTSQKRKETGHIHSEFLLMMHPLVNLIKWVSYIGYCSSSVRVRVRVQGKKVIITEADDGSLISCQAHPTHHSRSGGADSLLAVVDAVDFSFVQAFQVRPESRLKQRTEMALAKKLT